MRNCSTRRFLGAGGFALGAGARAAAVSALTFGILLAGERRLWATAAVLAGVAVLVVLDLMRSIRAADRTLAQFVEGVTAEGYERPTTPVGLRALGKAIQTALDRLAAVRAERQQRADFLEALADTVSAALLVVDDHGLVTGVNRAARISLSASAGPLNAIPALGAETVERLLALPAGAREIVRLADQRAILATVSGFTAAGAARRLIALQSLAGDLDAVEVKAWQDLVRVLAHEMMNSLTPICSLSESIAARLGEPHSPAAEAEIIESAEVIARRGQGLMAFVERYRQLTDTPAVVKARVPATGFVRRLDRLAEAMIGADAIAWSSAVQPAWLTLDADADLLEQAAINLIKNAFDAVRGRPDARVRLSLTLEEEQAVLNVADNGPGLPTDDPEGVFVPFFTTKDGGSGIGLTLARQIALGHGGRLEHRAASPNGAVFQLTLPAG
ncbi:sensor histidine kinase [Phenylobacterium sp.]|jgi:nitrogen fixation/metabolism regulation signal transduction histidine kinase|uniref:sensor histidine kinase n=1 Tax=Phenylobacterium sp. TaxID=1871053 RepID=UPI002E2F5161|nr:ATP-binding protein [Phenylobacterium sp.]HEX3366589.1 ATP-binding protein [Phenylobacterium sp.]